MLEKKGCPLCYSMSGDYVDYLCSKNICEWWNGDECSIKTLAKSIEKIAETLDFIATVRRKDNES